MSALSGLFVILLAELVYHMMYLSPLSFKHQPANKSIELNASKYSKYFLKIKNLHLLTTMNFSDEFLVVHM